MPAGREDSCSMSHLRKSLWCFQNSSMCRSSKTRIRRSLLIRTTTPMTSILGTRVERLEFCSIKIWIMRSKTCTSCSNSIRQKQQAWFRPLSKSLHSTTLNEQLSYRRAAMTSRRTCTQTRSRLHCVTIVVLPSIVLRRCPKLRRMLLALATTRLSISCKIITSKRKWTWVRRTVQSRRPRCKTSSQSKLRS